MIGPTISIHGIEWQAHRHEGRIAFSFGLIAIVFNSNSKRYEAWSLGKLAFAHESVSECLLRMTPVALDSLAEQFIPSWENQTDPMNMLLIN